MRFYQLAALIPFFLLGFQAPAQADQNELSMRLKTCRAISSMITRAQCYDLVIADFDLENMNRIDIGQGSGKWRVTSETLPVSGEKAYFASIISDDYTLTRDGKYNRPSLILRCAAGKMEGYIIWNETLGTTDVTVNYRLDNDDLIAKKWSLSSDLQASFIPETTDFTKKILAANTLNIKTWPSTSDPITATFDLRGGKNALAPLIENCQIQ